MQYNKVEISGVNTSKLKLLTEDEKTELLKKARGGDKKARDELIEGNLRLVLSVIQKFMNRGAQPDDLFQVGVVGLIKAIDNFDLSLDVRFSTYAVPMISGELRRYLRDNNSIRVSRSTRDLAYRAMQVKESLMAGKDREPTAAEISKVLGVPSQCRYTSPYTLIRAMFFTCSTSSATHRATTAGSTSLCFATR